MLYANQLKEFATARTTITEEPDWLLISNAISALDGRTRTGLLLIGDGAEMGICGGLDDRFYSFCMAATGEVFDLVNPESSMDTVEMLCSGAWTEFEGHQLVTKSTILIAARDFAEHGSRSPGLNWQSRGNSKT